MNETPVRSTKLIIAAYVLVAFASTPPPDGSAAVRQANARAPADTTTQVQMRNVDFFVDPEIALRIRRLRGTMRSKTGGPVIFDDKASFIIHIEAAEVGLTGNDLSLLLNKYVFAYPGAPLKHLRVTTAGNEIVQKGTLHKVLDLPFEIRASLSITPDGRIRIHPTNTKILGLPMDKVMKGLGLALDEIINLRKAKGATLVGNDILLDPEKILPPPSIEGRLTAIRVEGDQVVEVFGPPSGEGSSTLVPPDPTARNYMLYRGGKLQFGKLLMLDAEMQIVDLDPADPFHFDPDRYKPQLVAGYLRMLASGGLEVNMRDIDKIARKATAPVVGN
jgi:hypothetical protein